MNVFRFLFVIAFSFLNPFSAFAQEEALTGPVLLRECANEKAPDFCNGFLLGIEFATVQSDSVGNFVINAKTGRPVNVLAGSAWCFPASITQAQKIVLVDWLKANPLKMAFEAPSLVVMAWGTAYPCQ